MSAYKEFEAKTLDEAIRDACAYYDTTRDKLEIDILNDAKAGIFGLVGTKKARVRARLVELASVLEGLDSLSAKPKPQKKRGEPAQSEPRKGRREAREEAPRKERAQRSGDPDLPPETAAACCGAEPASPERETTPPECLPVDEQAEAKQTSRNGSRHGRDGRKERSRPDGRRARTENAAPQETEAFAETPHSPAMDADSADIDPDGEEFSRIPFDQLDVTELETAAREIVTRLTEPFLGQVTIGVSVGSDRVRVSLTDVEDPGLLIGRDGQTLASLQYLVTRMLSNRMKALLRVQIDAGDYRERQDERLREMALSLAEKVKAGGRPQVTRPLSSYHRRVIHLTLQDDPLIQTHSKGEGEMKRVMVARRKGQA